MQTLGLLEVRVLGHACPAHRPQLPVETSPLAGWAQVLGLRVFNNVDTTSS